MGQMTAELEALRAERAAAPATASSEISERAIRDLIAEGAGQRALKPGQKAPLFSLPNCDGRLIRLEDLLSKGPVVVSFYRGAWCPFCNIELRGLQQAYTRIRELHASLIAISPQLPDNSLSVKEKHSLEFPVLSDVGNSVAEAYGIVIRIPDELQEVYRERGADLAHINGDEGRTNLPIPATFIITPDEIIHSAFVNADHTQRTDPDDVIRILETL